MGDIVVTAFKVLGGLSLALLAVGAALRSRSLVILGGSMAISLVLTWILGLLGLPIGIFFGFLSFGGLFGSRSKRDSETRH